MAASSKNAILDRARKQVEAQLKKAENERREQMMIKRLEMVSAGVHAMKTKKPAEAAANFQGYVKILEEWKGVGEGTLGPNHFDYTKEMGDMLMLAGIYWELTKIYDLMEAKVKPPKRFSHNLEKFILFSRGTSWQPLCAEQLRRYLLTARPKHRNEFRNAYRLIGTAKCFIVSALAEDTELETISILREFRDRKLLTASWGRAFVRTYYTIGPALACGVRLLPHPIRKMMARGFDSLAQAVRS